MLIIKLKGGLGNQMFQFAFIQGLSLRNNCEYAMDRSFLLRAGKGYIKRVYKDSMLINYELDYFNLEKKFASRKQIPLGERIHNGKIYAGIGSFLNKIFIYKYFKEKNLKFDRSFLEKKNGYFDGYFQCEKYFIDYENEIRNQFEYKESLQGKNLELSYLLSSLESVSIHIRRGDYLSQKNASLYGTCDLDYYNNAISYIKKYTENPTFIFFSDDIDWVKNNLKEDNSYYVDWNTGENSYLDMRLMSLSKHNIIANSSFSWWGAWLNKNKNKIVIAPKKWINNKKDDSQDIVPETWVKI